MFSPQRIRSPSLLEKKSGSSWRDLWCQFRKLQNRSREWSRRTLSHFPSNKSTLGTLSCRSGNNQGSGSRGKSRGMEVICGMIYVIYRLKPMRRKPNGEKPFCSATECTQNFVGVTCLWKESVNALAWCSVCVLLRF